jgi:hypothetical protein
MRGSVLVFQLLPSLLLAACMEPQGTTSPSHSQTPSLSISDAVHSGGDRHFFFLPPLVPQPLTTGQFDAALSPVVEACEWEGYCVRTVAEFGVGTGAFVDIDASAGQYQVNWDTKNCSGPTCLDPGKTYRLLVYLEGGGRVLGYADLDVVSNGAELRNVETGEYIGLVNGRTLPIRFRIDRGIVGGISIAPNPVAVVTGGTRQLTATVTDLHGVPIPDAAVEWTSHNSAVAAVSATGLLTGVTTGCTSVIATSGGLHATADVMIAASLGPGPVIHSLNRSPVGTEHLDTVPTNQFPRGGSYGATVHGTGFCLVRSIAFSDPLVSGHVESVSDTMLAIRLSSSRVAEGDTASAAIPGVSFTLTQVDGYGSHSGSVRFDIVKGPPPRITLAVINGISALTVGQVSRIEYAAEVWSAGNVYFEFLAGPTTQNLTWGPKPGDAFHWTRSRIALDFTPTCVCSGLFTIGYGVVDGAGRGTRAAVTLPVLPASP